MFFERPKGGERTVLVHIQLPEPDQIEDLGEFRALALSAGIEVVAVVEGRRRQIHPKWFVGTGKLEEILQVLRDERVEVVIFNHALTSTQERNLEQTLKCRVLDRISLILDIFAQRARTFEGKLQVELAQLQHLSTRLVRGWTHLERQKGGIGLRGPGETQLEVDRRMIRVRMQSLTQKLEKVKRQRESSRLTRNKAGILTVSLVGYTNAGKSTLFNLLSESDVYVADQLFATLDPTLRRLQLPGLGELVLADTVGFIRHLPHKLVEAFRATLEAVALSDLLLHVIDLSHPAYEDHIFQVQQVLCEIGAEQVPQLYVYNKIDLLPADKLERLQCELECTGPLPVYVSADTRRGIEKLKQAMLWRMSGKLLCLCVDIPPKYSRLRSALHDAQSILGEWIQVNNGHWGVLLQVATEKWDSLLRTNGLQMVTEESFESEMVLLEECLSEAVLEGLVANGFRLERQPYKLHRLSQVDCRG